MLIMTNERQPLGGFHDPNNVRAGAVFKRFGQDDEPARVNNAINGVTQLPADEAAIAAAKVYGAGAALAKANADGVH